MSLNSIKGLFAKDNVMTAAGVVAGQVITSYVAKNYSDKLPGLAPTNTVQTRNIASIAYAVLVPGLAGLLIRKQSRALSDGLIVGGVAAGLTTAIGIYAPAETKAAIGMGEYLDRPAMRGLGAPITGSGYGAIQAFGGGSQTSVLGSATPFKRSNW